MGRERPCAAIPFLFIPKRATLALRRAASVTRPMDPAPHPTRAAARGGNNTQTKQALVAVMPEGVEHT